MSRPSLDPDGGAPEANRGNAILGVSGHRRLAEVDRLRAALAEVAVRIEARFPRRPWTILSGLAEGSDRMVARFFLERGDRLEAILPLAPEAFAEDFGTVASRREFEELLREAGSTTVLPPAGSRHLAYREAGRRVVDRCDVLIALWDGRPAASDAGTAAMVARARDLGRPVAWIHAGNRRPGTDEPTTLGPEQGTISFEGL